MADIIGVEHPLSGHIWLEAASSLGERLIREAALEIYGDANISRIAYVTQACEGAFITSRMAAKGAVVVLPMYTLHGKADGEAALVDLG